MEKLKGKYEVILGFVTLVVSLSAFKAELAKVQLELGYITISLAKYFLYSVYGFSLCLYLYLMEHIVRETKIGTWKVFNYFIWAAYILFVFIILTPIALTINIVAFKIYSSFVENNIEQAKDYFQNLAIILVLLNIIVTVRAIRRQMNELKKTEKERIEEQEIIELDNANKLFIDGYYSHSVLESFKVLETHLYKELTDKNHRVPRYRLNEIISLALKEGVILEDDLPAINDLKGMRNISAHSDTNHTKQQAEFALNFVKKLINRT
jgi:hypothetical protein